MNKKTVKVKAWAIIIDDSFKEVKSRLEYADVLIDNDCPASEPTDALAIYKRRHDALQHKLNNRKIVRCEITYTIPNK